MLLQRNVDAKAVGAIATAAFPRCTELAAGKRRRDCSAQKKQPQTARCTFKHYHRCRHIDVVACIKVVIALTIRMAASTAQTTTWLPLERSHQHPHVQAMHCNKALSASNTRNSISKARAAQQAERERRSGSTAPSNNATLPPSRACGARKRASPQILVSFSTRPTELNTNKKRKANSGIEVDSLCNTQRHRSTTHCDFIDPPLG